MKYFILILSIVLFTSLSFAADKPQRLVCEASPVAMASVEVETTRGGTVEVVNIPYILNTDGEVGLLDLSGFPNGAYIFRARFVDASGWKGDWCEPFKAVKSGKPEKLGVR